MGLDVSHHIHLAPEGRGKYFFLDIPSHRMSEIGINVNYAEALVFCLRYFKQ